MHSTTLFRHLWLGGSCAMALACGDDSRLLGEKSPNPSGTANANSGSETTTSDGPASSTMGTSTAAGDAGGSGGTNSGGSGGAQTTASESTSVTSTVAGGTSSGGSSAAGSGGGGGTSSGAGGTTPCGDDMCGSDEWCCGPAECGTCFPLGTDPACPDACEETCGGEVCGAGEVCCGPSECGYCIVELTGPACPEECPGSGGSGGSTATSTGGSSNDCDPGCEPVLGSTYCGGTDRLWECAADYNLKLMQDNCVDVATGLIRYCCPESFLSECTSPAGTT